MSENQSNPTLEAEINEQLEVAAGKPAWYRFEAFWTGDPQKVMEIGGEDVVVKGWVPPGNDVAVCLVPPSITHDQGLALQKMLEANFRSPILVLTNNTQMVRLKRVPDAEAQKILERGADGTIHVETGSAEAREEAS